jgi:glycosyltransferase involved in cell wall biosynthesis
MGSINPPVVSIIIPVHNSGSWIRDTIDNVISQTYPCREIIIVDDGSTDNTKQLIDIQYGESVKYFYQDNAGPARARNRGIEVASGEYIQFLDSDDFLSPDKIARQMAVFMANPECHVVYCDFAFTSEGTDVGVEESPAAYKKKYGTENMFEALLDSNFIVIHSPLTRTEVIRNCGAFDTTLSSDEDYDLWLRIAGEGYRFCFVPEVLAFYRKRGNSVSTNLFKQSRGTLQALNKAKSYRKKLTEKEREKLRCNLSREYGWTSRHYLSQGNYSKALSDLLQSIVNNPRNGLTVVINLLKQVIGRLLNRHLLWRFHNK